MDDAFRVNQIPLKVSLNIERIWYLSSKVSPLVENFQKGRFHSLIRISFRLPLISRVFQVRNHMLLKVHLSCHIPKFPFPQYFISFFYQKVQCSLTHCCLVQTIRQLTFVVLLVRSFKSISGECMKFKPLKSTAPNILPLFHI